MFNLTGKRALITGATGGLGGAIARKLHKAGAKVVLSGTREEKLQELAAELGEGAFIAPCNLSKGDEVDELPGKAAELMGGNVDILVSNAGLTRDGLLMRMKQDDWDIVQRVNLEAYFRMTKACLRPMMKARSGRIIGISSVVGVSGNAGQANYAASKAGMIGFTKSVAAETAARGITANCIAPGFISSPMTDALNDKQREAILTKIPAGRLGSGEDIANATLFLASDEANYITGQTLHINGGMIMI